MSVLIDYVDQVLTPTDAQVKFLKSKIRRIRSILTKNSHLAPKEVHTGGSLEKGTMLAHHLDGDVLCIYNREEEVGNNWHKLMLLVHKDLEANFPQYEVEKAGKLAIHVKTLYECPNCKPQEVNIDVVPCYYVNSPKMMNDHTHSKLYAAITTIWHSRFLVRYKNRPYFTQVVKLLKDWKNEHEIPLIKGIHLELITADTYDCNFDDVENINNIDEVFYLCLEDLIDTLDGYPIIPDNWKYCNPDDYQEHYDIPVLIDPANPRDNLLRDFAGDKEARKKLRRKVKKTMENIKQQNYTAIFNAKGLTNYFDE